MPDMYYMKQPSNNFTVEPITNAYKGTPAVKSTLGPTARAVHEEWRISELLRVMQDRISAGQKVPQGWLDEFNELMRRFSSE